MFGLVVAKFLNKGEDHLFVLREVEAELFGVLGLALLFIAYHFGTDEGLMYLCIEVFAVGNDEKSPVA